MYKINFSDVAAYHLAKLKKDEKQAYNKAQKLLEELMEHPKTGTGKPKQLKHKDVPTWSRRISEKHRLVYQIEESIVTVLVVSTYGHYDDN